VYDNDRMAFTRTPCTYWYILHAELYWVGRSIITLRDLTISFINIYIVYYNTLILTYINVHLSPPRVYTRIIYIYIYGWLLFFLLNLILGSWLRNYYISIYTYRIPPARLFLNTCVRRVLNYTRTAGYVIYFITL